MECPVPAGSEVDARRRGAARLDLEPCGASPCAPWPRRQSRRLRGVRPLYPNAWYRASARRPPDRSRHWGWRGRARPVPRSGDRGRSGQPARPRASSWRARRSMRALLSASMNSFTSASGQITVPMSRPSSTAPPGWCGEIALKLRAAPRAPRRSPRPCWRDCRPRRWSGRRDRSRCGGVERLRGGDGRAPRNPGVPRSVARPRRPTAR